jgi:hypothetical protein
MGYYFNYKIIKEKNLLYRYVLQDKFEKLASKPSTFVSFYELFKEIKTS